VRPSLLDLHEEPCSLAVAEVLFLCWLLRVDAPVVLYSAQNIPKRYPWPISWLERRALAVATGVYVCNRDAGLILRAKGFSGVLAEIPLGVDLQCFHPGERDAPSCPPLVGYVGRLARHKGVEVLLRAVAAEPEWRLVLYGEGPDRPRLEALVEQLGLEGRVNFAGSRRAEELADAYRSLDVLAVPSVPWPGWLEQFGRVVVEAMASGVPVVASRSGALPDVVEGAGVLVAAGDPAALREGLASVLGSPERWRACRAGGLLRAEKFSWAVVAEAHGALYEAVRRGRAAAIQSGEAERPGR
jgi:glycosyltransferase involved in cell wall biosynthesis